VLIAPTAEIFLRDPLMSFGDLFVQLSRAITRAHTLAR
jgi:hypothetical protein